MHTLLSVTMAALNQLIQPYFCIFCYSRIDPKNNIPICSRCLENKEYNRPPFCKKCGRSIKDTPSFDFICAKCLLEKKDTFKIFYIFKYTGVIKEGLHKLKYEGQLNLLNFFANELYAFWKEYITPFERIDYISYVPLHPRKQREREFNQAYLLAKQLAKKTGLPLLKNALSRKIYTKPQNRLSVEERRKNVKGAFLINKRFKNIIPGSRVLLIDDIITTASTAKECVKEFRKYNAETVVFAIAGG